MFELILKLRKRILQFRRRMVGQLGLAIASVSDPVALVRTNMIEEPELESAFNAFDKGNYVHAFKLFEELAQAGNASAQNNLGVLYETATGFPIRQDELAQKWYRKAAEQGLAEAQFNLAATLAAEAMAGLSDHSREQESQRFVETYMWLLLAEIGGHPLAVDSLRRLEPHMTENQLEQAEALAQGYEVRG